VKELKEDDVAQTTVGTKNYAAPEIFDRYLR